jgi:hypothetical protein
LTILNTWILLSACGPRILIEIFGFSWWEIW